MTDDNQTRHCFAAIVDNQPGVLARIVGLFSARGYNIESLSVDEVDREKALSRVTIASSGTQKDFDQIKTQVGRLVPVRCICDLTEEGPLVERALALFKLSGEAGRQAAARGGRFVEETDGCVLFEFSGTPETLTALADTWRGEGLIEFACSGSVALSVQASALS